MFLDSDPMTTGDCRDVSSHILDLRKVSRLQNALKYRCFTLELCSADTHVCAAIFVYKICVHRISRPRRPLF